MLEKFDGFSSSAVRFLENLRDNNRKEWFELHKQDYQDHVLNPLQALSAGLGPFMLSIDPEIDVTPALNRTISRIYRDTRFSKDKSPYKINHWITFKRMRKDWKEFPAYFFETAPDSYRYGMGFYSADRDTMDKFRKNIDANPQSFLSAISFYSKQNIFTIEGEEYKRPLKTDIPGEYQRWYNRKNIYLVRSQQIEGHCIDKKLINDLRQGFDIIASFYHYLCKVTA
jgi:uncharacterized protein (TIGR02453 family)